MRGIEMSVQQAIITLVAAVVSGVFATVITICINSYNEQIQRKKALVDDIFGFKYQLLENEKNMDVDIYSKGFCRAINRVPIIFDKEKEVLEAYDKFYDTLSIHNPEERRVKSDEALIDLLKQMCKATHVKCNNWNDSRFKRVCRISK